jgi:cystathionine beta-lyase/cystathionine gamma-synthase
MTDYDERFRSLATNVVHAGRPRPRIEGAAVTPVFQSSNYLMEDEASYDEVRYIRLSNSPSHLTIHARLSTLESGTAALVTASGMAAISTALLASLGVEGGHLLTQRTLYGGSQSFFDRDVPRFGGSYTAVDLSDPGAWSRDLRSDTRAFYVESISNPLMEVGDLVALVEFCREHRLTSIIDNTFATPVNFRPLELGFDVVVHSATKYLNGHSDLVAGVIVSDEPFIREARDLQAHLGGSADPHTCFLLERGLKTLVLRVSRQNASALRLASFLSTHPAVTGVNYPGLPDSPSHRFAKELFSGFGGMLSFRTDTIARAEAFLDRVRIPLHAASLGSTESLVVRPSRSSHLGQSETERRDLGIGDDLIRVSVGIEDCDELIADFDQALGR